MNASHRVARLLPTLAVLLLLADSASSQGDFVLMLQEPEPGRSDEIWKVASGEVTTANYSGDARYARRASSATSAGTSVPGRSACRPATSAVRTD